MAESGKKPNNELYELNDLLSGVDAADESVEDILAEIYDRPKPSAPAPKTSSEDAPGSDTPAPAAQPEPEPTPPPTPEPEVPVDVEAEAQVVDVAADAADPEEDTPAPPPQKPLLHLVTKDDLPPEPKPSEEVPDTPSAWVEPTSTQLPPELIASVFDDLDDGRPDGYSPTQQARLRQQSHISARKALEEEEERHPVEEPSDEEPEKGSRLARLRAKANAFADAMFSQEPAQDMEADLAEKYIPGTDDEVEAPQKPLRKPRRERPPEEDVPPQKLSRLYFTGLNFMSRRVGLLALLTFVNAYLSIASDLSLPLPELLLNAPTLLVGVQLWLLVWAIVFSLDAIWMSFAAVKKRLLGFGAIGSAAAIATVVDALVYCAAGRTGPAPYCAPATLILFGLLWGYYDQKLANYRACRQAAYAQEPYRITREEQLWNARDTFTKAKGSAEGFGSQLQAPNGPELAQARIAPLVLLAAVLFAFLSSVGHGRPDQLLWCLSAILVSASPLSALLCYAQPWLRLTRRLEKVGAAVAGWPGVQTATGSAGVLISDTDLFPVGSVDFRGIKLYGKISLEKVAGCSASLIRASGSGLTDLFDGLVRAQGGFYRRVDDFRCYEAGGLSGTIRGEQVMIGNAAFMTVMDIPLPQNLKVKNAVFCAIDGALRGIFVLNYSKSESVLPAVQSLLNDKLVPVLVPRDFNITPAMARQKLKLPVERMEYPPVERRMELTEPDLEHDPTLTALLSRDSVESYAETIVGSARLRGAVMRSSVFCLIASLVGLFMSYYLTASQAFSSLTPSNLLAFLALWLIPTLLFSSQVNRY
jgi:hypothetical protein